MALLDFSRSPNRSVAFADRFHTVFSATLGAAIAWNDARRTRDALSQLSAHELHDIGLHRGDIDTISGNF